MSRKKHYPPHYDWLSFAHEYDWPKPEEYDLTCEDSRCRFLADHLYIVGEIIIHGFKELVDTLREKK